MVIFYFIDNCYLLRNEDKVQSYEFGVMSYGLITDHCLLNTEHYFDKYSFAVKIGILEFLKSFLFLVNITSTLFSIAE